MGGLHSRHHGHRKPESIEDLQHITDCPADDMKIYCRTFLREYPNGYINHDEMKSLYARLYPNGDPTKFADHAFRAFEKNEHGHIDFKKFICALGTMSGGTLEDKLQWTFALYDVDGNGLITREGMTDVFDALYKMWGPIENMPEDESTPSMTTAKVFAALDKKNTGVLTLQKFLKGAMHNADLREILQGRYRGRSATK